MRLIDFFDKGVKHFPSRPFLVDGAEEITFAEAWRQTNKIARYLKALQLPGKPHVAVLSPNCSDAFIAVLGLLRAGFAWVPINNRNLLEDHINFLNLTEVSCVLYHSEYSEQAQQLMEQVATIKCIICIDAADRNSECLSDAAADYSNEPVVPDYDEQDICSLFSTGGTTGRPKAAIWSHKTWATMIANYQSAIAHRGDQTMLVVAPMTHAAGVVSFAAISLGTTNVIAQSTDPAAVLADIERYRITSLFLPPTLIYMMLASERLKDFDYSSLQNFVYAAAPMSTEKLRQAIEVFGPVMTQTYGQAEAPMVCTVFSSDQHMDAIRNNNLARLASCGRETLLTRVSVLNDDGKQVADGEVGEIAVGGDLVMDGYYNNPEETQRCKVGGWHRTGDLGYRDKGGYLYITDRKRDMIITGGFNVFPSEVEQVIWSHPAIQDCAVIGIPDEKWGECVAAVIELKSTELKTSRDNVDENEIISLCKEKLGSVKAPKKVFVWPSLPRSPVGKVLKRKIRDHFWQGRDSKL